MRLLFKFRESAPPGERERVLVSLRGHGAHAVERLFPDARDDELASHFVIDAGPDQDGTRLLELLKEEGVVEYAETEVQRKLVS